MGIPSYFSNVIKRHGKIVREITSYRNGFFTNLYMDCNSIIYDAVRNIDYSSSYETDIIRKVIHKIEQYIELIGPSNTIYIAFDGVAPFAKMNQQRTRRFKGDFISNNSFVKPVETTQWSTSNITPGTNFMNKLSETINSHFMGNQEKYGAKELIVSASDERGEGEHKIFEYIREKNKNDENMLLYGLDSDLIMLTIFNRKFYDGGYIFREAPEFMNVKSNINKNDKEPYVLDIEGMCTQLVYEMDCNNNEFKRVYDYVFMCFLLGNDFLPHFPGLNIRTHGIETLMVTYRNTIGNKSNLYIINEDMTINWRVFKRLISQLAKHEHEYILDEYTSRDRFSKKHWKVSTEKEREYTLNCVPLIERSQEVYISPKHKFWERRYYVSLLDINRDNESLKTVCNNYIEGLEWTLKYYCGKCPNWKWNYKYSYPPLFVDLINFLPDFSMEFITTNNTSFSSDVQLAYVLPPRLWNLLPTHVRKYLLMNHSELFSDDIQFKWAFCKYFWESHVENKSITIELLELWNNKFKNIS